MNMGNINLYKKWAPDDAIWTAWAKPVLFASLKIWDDTIHTAPAFRESAYVHSPQNAVPPALVTTDTALVFSDGKKAADSTPVFRDSARVSEDARFRPYTMSNIPETPLSFDAHTAVIVDLPGKQGVHEALALAHKGYRPVPLYNGVKGPGRMLVDVQELGNALCAGADMLATFPLTPTSPPVFMLDSDRMKGFSTPSSFDNRWCLFSQDMPSAQFLKNNGINKIIVQVVHNLSTDLERILYDYQKNGIALYVLRYDAKELKELTVHKQSFAEEWIYRLGVVFGLKRNATGGFGGYIPDPYERGGYGGGHYYRYG